MESFKALRFLTLLSTFLTSCSALPTIVSRSASAVLAVDFPDPALIESGGSWYAFATSGNGKNIQVARSSTFLRPSWGLLGDIDPLPDPGPWTLKEHGGTWAPDVIQLDNGLWVMYYAAPSAEGPNDGITRHCIGAATSNNVLGPYQPTDKPLACPLNSGGAIDPDAFLDPNTGNLYVVYKVDGNNLNTGGGPCNGDGDPKLFHSTPIMVQRVSTDDGITTIGEAFQILDRDAADGPLIESPSMFYNPESKAYFMTFSSNCYSTDLYDISYAYSTCLEGPWTKSQVPLMTTQTGPVAAPGGADMTPDGKFAVFHGTVATVNGNPVRYMFAAQAEQLGYHMQACPI